MHEWFLRCFEPARPPSHHNFRSAPFTDADMLPAVQSAVGAFFWPRSSVRESHRDGHGALRLRNTPACPITHRLGASLSPANLGTGTGGNEQAIIALR